MSKLTLNFAGLIWNWNSGAFELFSASDHFPGTHPGGGDAMKRYLLTLVFLAGCAPIVSDKPAATQSDLAAVMALGTGASVSAQGAAASAVLDGEYTGTATPNAGLFANCVYIINPIMTIAAPQVTIHTYRDGQPYPLIYSKTVVPFYSGTVDQSGRVSASMQAEYRAPRGIMAVYWKLSGTITGSNFTGKFLGSTTEGSCTWDVSMTKKQPS
jgi:hypothetical protein